MSRPAEQLWETLLQAGLVDGGAPATDTIESPWYVKAILAFSPAETAERLIAGELPQLTANTITGIEAYKSGLAETRRKGYSFDNEEIDIGINAVGVPIFDHASEPIAAVVVAGPAQRITGEEDTAVVVLTRKTAAEISRRMDYRGGIVDGQNKAV